jgi:membrane protease YdiL (CAAX protease family)
MNKIKKSIQKSPIIWFFLLTFGFSWGIWLPSRLFLSSVLSEITNYLHTLGLFAPTFSAIIVTGTLKGKPGIIELLKRITYWRAGWPWYLFVLFSTAVIGFLAIGLYVIMGGTAPAISFFIFLPGILTMGLTEEIGWRGFALPELQKKYSALTSAVIIGVIWASWHFVITPGNPLFLMVFTLEVVILSILFTWVYNNTNGSILLAALYHTIINIVISNLKIPTIPGLWLIYLLLQLLLVLVIIWRFGPRHLSLSRKENSENR